MIIAVRIILSAIVVIFNVLLYGYGFPAVYDAGYCSEQVALGGKPCDGPTPLPIPYWGPWPPPR
jgi:hypothetical protein